MIRHSHRMMQCVIRVHGSPTIQRATHGGMYETLTIIESPISLLAFGGSILYRSRIWAIKGMFPSKTMFFQMNPCDLKVRIIHLCLRIGLAPVHCEKVCVCVCDWLGYVCDPRDSVHGTETTYVGCNLQYRRCMYSTRSLIESACVCVRHASQILDLFKVIVYFLPWYITQHQNTIWDIFSFSKHLMQIQEMKSNQMPLVEPWAATGIGSMVR